MTPTLSIHDYENTSIAITPAERQELLDIFEFRTKSCPPVLWTKFFDFHEKLLASTTDTPQDATTNTQCPSTERERRGHHHKTAQIGSVL